MSSSYQEFLSDLVEALESVGTRRFCRVGDVIVYTTQGGSAMVASDGKYNDDGRPHDLVAVTPFGEVVQVRPTANPDLVEGLRAEIARRSAR